ncbi:hypothetical protein [Cellulosimicrobium sp. Marseille-Q4280]|uniref:hypothetical protein n=1 Tax=Cellulosimicrobium sp. Marseille-Q4280 TaxID=2937992 RepID=UPI00203D9CF4|nr:hypothetical protein [Cellulosimicrobium sp. Marseille-Q4280]
MTEPITASVEPARARTAMPGPDERFRRSVIAASTWEQRHGYARAGTKDATEAQIVRLRRTLRAARTGRSGLPWSPAHQAFVDAHWPGAWKEPSRASRYVHRDALARQRTAEAAEATAAAAAAAKAARAAARKAPRPAPAASGGGYVSATRAARDEQTFRARVQRAAAWEAQHGRPVARTVEDGGIEHFNFRSRLRAAAAGTGRMKMTADRLAYLDEHWPSWRSTTARAARPATPRSSLDRFTDKVRDAAAWEAQHGRRAAWSANVDRDERAVAQLGTYIRSAVLNGTSPRFAWNENRHQIVRDLWPDALEQRIGSVVRRGVPLRQRILAAAAWEARNGEAREDAESVDERGVAHLRGRLRRASAGDPQTDSTWALGWDDELAQFVAEHWPSALRDGRETSGEEAFRDQVLAAAAWEAEHGRAATNSETDSHERSIYFLRRRIRDARAGRVNGQLAWTAQRDEFVAEHWDLPESQRRAPGGGRPADEQVFQDRVRAAAAWEAVFGRSVSRTVPEARPFQMLRTAMRRAAAGHSTMAWSPEREAFADEHWPNWRA